MRSTISLTNDERGHGKVLDFACDGCRVRSGRMEHKFMDWREVPAAYLHLKNQKKRKPGKT